MRGAAAIQKEPPRGAASPFSIFLILFAAHDVVYDLLPRLGVRVPGVGLLDRGAAAFAEAPPRERLLYFVRDDIARTVASCLRRRSRSK